MRSESLSSASWSSTPRGSSARTRVRLFGVDVFQHVAVDGVAVADGRVEADGVLDEVEQLVDALDFEAALLGDLVRKRVAVELLGEDAAGAHDATHLVDDVHRESDRAPLVGNRARDGLADPPRRVRGELVAHLVVELLHRPDEAEVAFLDQVEHGTPELT